MASKCGAVNCLVPISGFVMLCVACLPSGAQEAPLKKFPERKFLDTAAGLNLERATMAEIVQKLSATAHVSILVDGEPNQNLADFRLRAPVRDVFDSLAKMFDYDWTLTRANVAVFRKRFRVRGEMPQAHLAEMQQLMKDIVSAVNLAPKVERGSLGAITPWIRKLILTLTPEQAEALRQGNSIPATLLSQDQLSLLHSAFLAGTFDDLERQVDYYAPLMAGMETSYLVTKERLSVPNADAATHPQRDYVYVVRDKSKKLLSHYLVTWSVQ